MGVSWEVLGGADVPGGLARLLDRVEYKPGWRFQVMPDGPGRILLVAIREDVLDAYGSGKRSPQMTAQGLPASDVIGDGSDEMWVHVVHDVLSRAEQHEVDEWFRVGGVRPFDPHASDRGAEAMYAEQAARPQGEGEDGGQG